jgi:DNA-binding transcriptional LysR family regulator
MLDPKLLRTFVVVGRVLHFGRAAQILHSTQPGVTQHIAKLEALLGVPLFKRSKRSVEMTDAGKIFARQASRVLALLEKMEIDAARMSKGFAGMLTVGMSSSIICGEVPDRIARFKKDNPAVNVRVLMHSDEHLQELLDSFAIDVMITTSSIVGSDYVAEVLQTSTKMGVALPRSHAFSECHEISIRELAGERLVSFPTTAHPQAHEKLSALLHAREKRAVADNGDDYSNAVARVAMGEGIAIVPIAYASLAPRSVCVVPLSDPELSAGEVHLVVRSDSEDAIALRFLRELAERKEIAV